MKGIDNIRNSAKELNSPIGCIFHFSIYIFSLLLFPSNEIIIIDSHPVNEEIGGNGNGIVVYSLSKEKIYNWIMKRAMQSKVLSKSVLQWQFCIVTNSVKLVLNVVFICFFCRSLSLVLNIITGRIKTLFFACI